MTSFVSVENAPSSPLKSPSAAAIAARTWLSDWGKLSVNANT
jgi:hypothetical protein